MANYDDLLNGFDEEDVLVSAGYAPRTLRFDPFASATYTPDTGSIHDANAARESTELGKGYKSGRLNLEASYLAAEEASLRAKNEQAAADLLARRRAALEERAAVFAPSTQELTDVLEKPSLRSAGNWLASNAGQLGASMVDPFTHGLGASALARGASAVGTVVAPFTGPAAPFVAGASRLLGAAAPYIGEAAAFVPGYEGAKGGAYRSMLRDPELMARTTDEQRDTTASFSGAGQAALDTLIPGAMRRRLMGENLYGAAERGLNRLPLVAGAALDSLGEGAQEVVQDRMEKAALSYLNPDRDTSGDLKDAINNFGAGLFGSAPMSAGSRYLSSGRERLNVVGDGQNGDVIDLNAPATPEGTLNPVEQLMGKPGKFNDRESKLAMAAALDGFSADDDGTEESDLKAIETRRNLLIEHLKKIRGSQAVDLLTLIEATPFETSQDKYATFADENFDAATALVKRKLKLRDTDLPPEGVKLSAEEPHLEGFGDIPREAVDKLDERPPTGSRTGPIDPASFTFESTPDMFADLQPDDGEFHGPAPARGGDAGKARYEEAKQKAKVFDVRSGLVAQRLWKAYTDERGYDNEETERDAGPAGDIQRISYERVRRNDPGAVENIRALTSELMAISTIDTPTSANERRADRVARELVGLVGDQAGELLADVARVTGGSKFLQYASDEATRYARTDRAGLQAQFEDRDAAAQELVKLIPAEVEARLLKEHGIDLSSNKDRNDILDLMEDVADGKTSIPRIKLTKLFTGRVVDAMEGYLGSAIMPRMAGVREELIDENDSSGGMAQTANTEDVHDTEVTAADFRDIAEEGADEVSESDAGAAEKSHSKVGPEAMVYHWAGTKKSTVADFTKAWDRNDEGRLPKLLHPGDDKMLERVQTLAGLAAERLGDQRDRYVIGNPLAKDPIEAAGGTSAKKLMDRAGMSDDKRTQLMLEYMQQEDKSGKFDPTEANDVVKKIHFLTAVDNDLTDVLVNRSSIGPYGGQLTTREKVENRGKPLDIPLDRLVPLVPPSDAAVLQRLFDSRKDVNTRVSNETLMTTVAPIVHRAKQLALEHMKNVVPGVTEFIAEKPGAELKDFVNNYFSQRYAVVAEQPTDRDYLQLSPTEFRDMAIRGAKALKSVYNDVGTDEAAQTVARAGRNVIHFESPHAKSGVVSIPAHALVEWVRDGRNAHTKDKNIGEESRGSLRSQHDSYRDDLGEGISALTQNGLVTGLPWIVNAAGEREDFAPSTPRERTGSTDDFGDLIRPMQRGESRQITDDFGKVRTVDGNPVTYRERPNGERIPVVSEDFGDHKTSKAQNYFVTQTGHAVKDGWKRAGVGALPPSLDLDGISVKEYNEQRGKKAYAQKMQTQADVKAKAELRAGMTPEQRDQFDRNEYAALRIKERREEAAKNKELSQDPVDVQGEEAVDEAMRISEGSQTRKDEREHIQLMTSVMRAAADHLPGALTVKGAVNKAASVAGNVWKTYLADPEAGLARMAGYIRSISRGKHSGDYEGQKAFREIWSDYHALEDVQDKTWNPNLVGAADRDPKGNLRKDMALKTVQTAAQHPALVNAEATAVGGPHYALPLAAVLTPRNLEAARPQDKTMLMDMRARVAATIQTLWSAGKIDSGQVRKLVNHLSGFTEATLREKQDRKVPPIPLAQVERVTRRAEVKIDEGFVPNAKVRDFLNGIVKAGNTAAEPQYQGTGFQGGRHHAAADPVWSAKTKPLAVGGPVRGRGSTLAERKEAVAKAPTVGVATPLLKNPPSAPAKHQPKETAKLLGADRVIAPISPEGYAGDLGRAAQAEGKRFSPKIDTDMTGKVVVVSVPGRGRGFTGVDKIIEHVKMALDRGATVLTDNEENATRPHNAEGEGVLRQALIDGGYTEAYTTEHFSAWQKIENPEKHTPSSPIQAPGATTAASEGAGSQNALATAIAKHQEYLKNPPEDYTTERAAAIGTWAAKQHARVVAELAKTDDSTDQYDRLDELRFKLDQLGKASAAKVAESTEAEEHERKYGPQVVTADPSKDPEAMSAEKPPELSKAEIATLDKFVTNANRTNTGKLALGRRREVLIPSLGGAVRRKFHVVDEVNRSMDTYAPEWTRILNYVLGKDNWHTEWSSMGDNDITAWVVNDKLTSTAEEILDRLELLVRNNLDKLSSEARERVERLWAGEKDLLNPEQRAKATLATKVEERNGLAQRLKDAEYQVSYRRAKYESNRTDRVLERISREALEREETDRGEISKKLAEIDAEIAALEAKLGPQGGAPSAVKDFDSYVAKGYYSQWYKDSVSKVGKEATDKLSDIIRQYRLSQIPELAGANIAADRSTVENIPDNVVQKLAAAAPGLFGRVMVGNHGVYVEYTPSKRLDSGRGALVKEHLQYTEYKHRKGYKIYEQTKGVNYADYRVGMGYIAVDEILGGEPQGAVKRNAEDTTVEPKAVAAALVETRDIMRMMGFKTAPAQFVNVAEKLLTDPDQDLAGFIKDSAKALSHVLTGETNFEAIREALSSTDWAIERAKIVAKLVKQGMMRGDAMVESYRVLTEMALTGELAVRTAEEKRGIAKLMQMVRELVAKFKRMVGSAEFADVVRGMLNKAIEEANTPLKLKEGFKQVSFQEAVDGDPTSAAVLAHVSTNPNVTLTGSIVLAAGGTIYRNAKNMLHDLDLLVRGSKADAEAHLREAFPDAVQVYDFKTSNGKVDTFIVPPKGATVEDITRAGNTPGKGRIQGFRIVKDGKEIGRTWHDADGNEQKSGVTGTLVDFFTETDTDTVSRIPFTVGNKRYQIGVAPVGHIFDAKLAIHRDKDINDYKRFVPNVGDEITKAGTKLNAEALTEKQAAAQFDQLSKMSAPPPKHIQVTSAIKYFERTLGDKVNLILKDSFPDMKIGGADYNLATNVARIATANPWRIMRLAYHESVHGVFNTILNAKGMEATKEMLYRAASEPKMYARLKELLKGHPNALKDMEADMEERVAYMFQFWKLDMLTIDKKPETFFEKVQAMMRRVFGAVRDSEKALAILTAFDEGGLKEPSAAGQVIAKIMSQGEWHKQLLARFDAQAQAAYSEVMAAHNVFRGSESKTGQTLGKMFYTNPGYGADAERVRGVQEGMLNRTQFKRNYYSNRIRDALKPLQGVNAERDLAALAEALNAHTEPTSELVRTAKDAIGKILNEFRSYAKSSGLDLGKQLGADKRYWPRVYEIEKLINGKDAFVNMLLTRHGKLMRTIASTMRDSGKYPEATEHDAAAAVHQSLVDRLGVEDSKLDAERDDGVLSPYFASQNERKLDWMSDEDVKPYLSTDVIGTLTQYISQGVRAVEYTKMFGERGQSLKEMLARKGELNFVTAEGKPVYFEEDGPILRELKDAAPEKDKDAWVERRFDDLKRASGAMEGSLGKDISAGYRKLQAGLMTYQILRLLPLMIFSSMLDPNGIRVAGGDYDDMFAAYKRGFVGLWKNWKDLFLGNPFGSRDPDELEMAALAAGVINSDAINEEMGEVHSSEYSSGMSRRINHAFFKAIGITQWDMDMRIMATAAARKAIVNHFNNTVPEHSARWLRELGLKRGDVHLNDKGELIVSAAELAKKLGIKPEQAQRKLEPTHFAVNRWVSRAIVSPNAGLRPTRASDPHYAMFFQFKSFTYAFQETTMRYALHEAQNGNSTAALQLLRGVPIMIAADMTKAMVTGGGSLPGYMANWTLLDWVGHGINRAGLMGTGSFAGDLIGGNISGTLAGPTVGQAFNMTGDILTGDIGGAVTQSLPGVKQLSFLHT